MKGNSSLTLFNLKHEETCWKLNTISSSIEDIFNTLSKEEKFQTTTSTTTTTTDQLNSSNVIGLGLPSSSFAFRHDELPTYNNVITIPRCCVLKTSSRKNKINLNDNDNDENDVNNYDNTKIMAVAEQIAHCYSMMHDQEKDGFKISMMASLGNQDLATSTSSILMSPSSLLYNVASVGYHYAVQKPINLMLSKLIGESDYAVTSPPPPPPPPLSSYKINDDDNDDSDDDIHATRTPMKPTPLTSVTPNRDGALPSFLSPKTPTSNIHHDKMNAVVDNTEQIICIDIVLEILEFVISNIIQPLNPPTILPVRQTDYKYTVIRQWIRSKIRPIDNAIRDKKSGNNIDNCNNDKMIDFILHLSNIELDLIINCLEILSNTNVDPPSNQMDRRQHDWIVQHQNRLSDTGQNDLWIIGDQQKCEDHQTYPLDVQIALYDLQLVQSKIEANIQQWESQIDICSKQIKKQLLTNRSAAKISKATGVVATTKIAAEMTPQIKMELQKRKLYQERIDTSRNLLLNLEQQQHSIESTASTQLAIGTMEQTAIALKQLRLNPDDNIGSQPLWKVNDILNDCNYDFRNAILDDNDTITINDLDEELQQLTIQNHILPSTVSSSTTISINNAATQGISNHNSFTENEDVELQIEEELFNELLKELDDLPAYMKTSSSTLNPTSKAEMTNQTMPLVPNHKLTTTPNSSTVTGKQATSLLV